MRVSDDEVRSIHQTITTFYLLAEIVDDDVAARYLEHARSLADGTLDAVLPHLMPISEMRRGQANLSTLIAMLEHILAIKKLASQIQKAERT